MKKTSLLFVFLCGIMATNCFAQDCKNENVPTATVSYDQELIENKEYQFYNYYSCPFITDYRNIEAKEQEILAKHATIMAIDLKKYVSQEDKELFDYENVKKLIIQPQLIRPGHREVSGLWDSDLAVCPGGIGYSTVARPKIEGKSFFYNYGFNGYFMGDFFTIKKSIRREISKNKEFRDAIFERICDFICDLVKVLPKDFEKHLEKKLQNINDEVLDIGKDIASHKYELKSYVYEGEWYYGQEWFYLEKDGQPMPDEYEVAFSSRGWWLRRIFIDKIPYEEIKSRSAELLARVKNVDNSKNADVLTIYKLAKGLLYCIGKEGRFLYSCATAQKYPLGGTIQKMKENDRTIFKITSPADIYEDSDTEQKYYQMGFRYKEATIKVDEDGNFLDMNVEYKK